MKNKENNILYSLSDDFTVEELFNNVYQVCRNTKMSYRISIEHDRNSEDIMIVKIFEKEPIKRNELSTYIFCLNNAEKSRKTFMQFLKSYSL